MPSGPESPLVSVWDINHRSGWQENAAPSTSHLII
jgi:hypothetical protein